MRKASGKQVLPVPARKHMSCWTSGLWIVESDTCDIYCLLLLQAAPVPLIMFNS